MSNPIRDQPAGRDHGPSRPLVCHICGDTLDRSRGARGTRCGTCDRHWHRHGVDRPDHLIIKQTEKDIERALTRRANCC